MARAFRLLLFLSLAFFPFCFRGYADTLHNTLLSTEEAQKLMSDEGSNLLILDVRTPAEYGGGHIANAQNVDFFGPVFEQEINRLDRDRPVLVYCQTGRRSEAAAQILKKADFKKIYDLKGGIKAWKKANLPITEKSTDR